MAYLISEAPIIGITGSNENNHNDHECKVLTAAGQHGLIREYHAHPASQVAQTMSDKDTLVVEPSFPLMGVQEFHPEIVLLPTHTNSYRLLLDYLRIWQLSE